MASWISSSFPPLDPNGQPFSMVLRGTAAELGDLRSALKSRPNSRQQLELEVQANVNANNGDEVEFCDDDVEGMGHDQEGQGNNNGCQSKNITDSPQETETERFVGDENDDDDDATENKKRTRDVDGEDSAAEDEADDEMDDPEKVLFYFPSIQCTCSSLNMKDVSGDMFVTTLRVLFLSEKHPNGEEQCHDDDVAIDGSCIALHAVDSLTGENNEAAAADSGSGHHVYCQLAEPSGDEHDNTMGMGCTSALSMIAPTQINEELDEAFNGDENEEEEEQDGSSGDDDGTIEIYFKPMIANEGNQVGNDNQCGKCQEIFDSLTKLASLNPAEDSGDGGGGLFSMLAMMAGLDANNGFGGEMVMADHDEDSNDDDDMVFRLGGSNNLVENDDEGSEGAPDEERQAMLQRLDDMLVVPPEYEIASSDDGQFDDAEEVDEIL